MGRFELKMAKYSIIDSAEKEKWNEFRHKCAYLPQDVFCFNEYNNLYSNDDCEVQAFAFEDNGKAFFLPYIKRPVPNTSDYYDFETAYGYSGPLVSEFDKNFISDAWKSFRQYCDSENIIAGFIRFHPIIKNHELAFPPFIDVIQNGKIVSLNLKDKNINGIWDNYASSNRNKIRLARKNGIETRNGRSPEYVSEFRKMYVKTMDRVNAEQFYRFEKKYFESIQKNLQDNFTVFLGFNENDDPIGASLVLFSESILTYYLSATKDEARKLGVANLLRHESINYALAKGISHINFGGGRTSSDDDSLFRYKKAFSDGTEDFYIGKIITKTKVYDEICREWEKKVSPEIFEKYKSRVLKYRF